MFNLSELSRAEKIKLLKELIDDLQPTVQYPKVEEKLASKDVYVNIDNSLYIYCWF